MKVTVVPVGIENPRYVEQIGVTEDILGLHPTTEATYPRLQVDRNQVVLMHQAREPILPGTIWHSFPGLQESQQSKDGVLTYTLVIPPGHSGSFGFDELQVRIQAGTLFST